MIEKEGYAGVLGVESGRIGSKCNGGKGKKGMNHPKVVLISLPEKKKILILGLNCLVSFCFQELRHFQVVPVVVRNKKV